MKQSINAKDILDQTLKLSLVPLAKVAGFKKRGLYFHRRLGDLVQVIHIQPSRGNTSRESGFYVNIGIAFDALYNLANEPVPERPKEYECHFRHRLEALVGGTPPYWTVTAKTNIQELADCLSRSLSIVIDMLESLSSVHDFSNHPWFDVPSDPSLRFMVYYAIGDYDAAWQEVQAVSERFSDRKGMSERDLVTRYNLETLKFQLANLPS